MPTPALRRSLQFIVSRAGRGWAVLKGDAPVSQFDDEWQALRAADMMARAENRAGQDTRVLVKSTDGRLFLERSYGRHPALG